MSSNGWASHGVDRVVLSLGYRADAFVQAFPANRLAGVALEYAVEPEALDTAGAIRFAAHRCRRQRHVSRPQRGRAHRIRRFSRSSRFIARVRQTRRLALTPVPDPSSFGVVPTDAAGRVTAFIEKPPAGNVPDQPDQCRHLRARALGARADPERSTRVDRTRDLSRAGCGGQAVRARVRCILARHRQTASLPPGAARHPLGPARLSAARAGDPSRGLGRPERERRRPARPALLRRSGGSRSPRGPRWRTVSSVPARASPPVGSSAVLW